jgi:hypothetical protein
LIGNYINLRGRSKYSRRKIESNAYRYDERPKDEELDVNGEPIRKPEEEIEEEYEVPVQALLKAADNNDREQLLKEQVKLFEEVHFTICFRLKKKLLLQETFKLCRFR